MAALPNSPTPEVAEMSFPDFLRWFFPQWKQGDHVTLLGPTGTGKTTLAQYLLRRFNHVTSFNTKGKDTSAQRFIKNEGFVRQKGRWNGAYENRILLWPDKSKGESPEDFVRKQYHTFMDAMNQMYDQTGWAWYFDEVSYLSDFLGMDRRLRWALQQTRSNDITVVAATQRPAFIPLAFYDQPHHLFFWSENDDTNLRRIKGIGGQNGKQIQAIVQSLGHREVLYIHTRYPYERIRFTVNLRGQRSV